MQMKPGSRWKSAVCQTEVAVVRPPKREVALSCGGAAMVAVMAAAPGGGSPAPDRAAGTLLGKRYADAESGLEVLCTKPGSGTLATDDRPMTVKESKALPSSD